ncbi:hypothetical protein J6590_057959 [Homalodisca vitripennis]|nr:hypothetical protein J6590_057959 [Homalodisca vitripennis]
MRQSRREPQRQEILHLYSLQTGSDFHLGVSHQKPTVNRTAVPLRAEVLLHLCVTVVRVAYRDLELNETVIILMTAQHPTVNRTAVPPRAQVLLHLCVTVVTRRIS